MVFRWQPQGTSVSEGLVADIQTLDQMDAEIEQLLKKRQNGFFSEKDQIRLQELIDTREAIEVKYHLTPEETGGFETISQKVEAEVARAQARGKTDADTSVYENAVKAAAEGMAAINAQIDERYQHPARVRRDIVCVIILLQFIRGKG